MSDRILDRWDLVPPFVAMDGLESAKQIVRYEEGEFLSKTELRKRGGVSSTWLKDG